jgi:hypothetical protein
MTKLLLLLLTAALGLTISAQAHLGWTLQDCQEHWGQYSEINDDYGIPTYVFKEPVSGMEITTQFYGDHVESICYITNPTYLHQHYQEILTANYSGGWQAYDDGRGRATVKTWKSTDLSAYAIITTLRPGTVRLQVSTVRYDAFLRNQHPEPSQRQVSNEALTNI